MFIDRRNPYRPFDSALIKEFREDFLRGRPIQSVQLLPDGRSNTNYKLSLKGGGTFLLRLRGAGHAAGEAAGMKLVRELVPVPAEIHRGDSWSVLTFLEGELLQRVPQYTFRAAEALAKISSVRLEATGWISATCCGTPARNGMSKSDWDLRPEARSCPKTERSAPSWWIYPVSWNS
jgi:hypothetical protein